MHLFTVVRNSRYMAQWLFKMAAGMPSLKMVAGMPSLKMAAGMPSLNVICLISRKDKITFSSLFYAM